MYTLKLSQVQEVTIGHLAMYNYQGEELTSNNSAAWKTDKS